MKICRYMAAGLTALFMAAFLSGCTTFDNFKAAFIEKPQDQKASIQIGVYEPMSGADSKDAALEIEGIELAHEQYPTVNGKVVELVQADNASDIYAAETAIKELILKEPTVILGSYGSVYSLIAGDYINEAKIPTIAITNANPLVTRNNDYYFRVCYVDSNQGDLLARYVLEERKEKTAGVLLPQEDDAAMAMTTAFTDRIKAETNNEDAIVVYEEYNPGDEDFTKQLDSIEQSGVKSVLLPGEINDSARIIKQAQQRGLDVVFLGDREWSTDEFREMAVEDTTEPNVAFVNFFAAEEPVNEEAEKFLRLYQEKHGKDSVPEDSVALGYDAYVIALDAIDKADDDATPEEVREVLAGQNKFQGASGLITFNNMGDPIKTAYISTWSDGKVVSLYTIDPTL